MTESRTFDGRIQLVEYRPRVLDHPPARRPCVTSPRHQDVCRVHVSSSAKAVTKDGSIGLSVRGARGTSPSV
ncbi:hypothetical protein GCM10018980_70760 [Streptomyces capoamus]|uniref:Uncharacterized protein n=1 Tax=Streptomyces capoamus TaxID=68183 RepID=A0A919F2S2_9ACTN|nr:hypothetical protein GCM10010501_17360 [Streptomyces libani subsp. rufus]GHG74084.1 hypothetical protein GCM10018980_70760 [Streptomyces capoamus]